MCRQRPHGALHRLHPQTLRHGIIDDVKVFAFPARKTRPQSGVVRSYHHHGRNSCAVRA
jgi:hypothetical protein